MKTEAYSITLNLPSDLSEEEWTKVEQVYRSIDGYIEPTEGSCPSWYGNDGDERFISVSAEPSGLLCEGIIDTGLWCGWLTLLCSRLSLAMGQEIRDAEM